MARNRRAQKPVPARSCLPVYRSGGESSMATAPKPGAAHTSNHWLGGPPGRALGRERGRNGGVALPVNPGRGQGADAGFRGRSGGCGGPGERGGAYGALDRLARPVGLALAGGDSTGGGTSGKGWRVWLECWNYVGTRRGPAPMPMAAALGRRRRNFAGASGRNPDHGAARPSFRPARSR